MEAARYGFGSLAPAFKFDPTDDDIVAHYLLPRALGNPHPPFAHAVIEADPASLPPPELLALHGHATSHHAFFLHVSKNGGRREREIKGGTSGTWRGQQGKNKTLTLLMPGVGELDIKYRRYDLTYKRFGEEDEEEDAKGKKRKRKNGGTPAGWVMHDYTIVSPPLQNIVLSRINRKAGKINEEQQQADFHQHHQVFPAIEQPGPSYYQGNFPYQEQAGPSHRHEFLYQEQPGPSHHHDFPYQEQAGPSHRHDFPYQHQDFPYQEQPGPSHHHDFPYQEQAGPSHGHDFPDQHQDFPYQEQPGPSHNNDFPYQEQAWPTHHHDFTYQQQAGPGPSHYQGFSDGSQADDASFYGDNPVGMGGGFVNMLSAGEGFAGDYHHPHDMTCGGGQGFSDGSQADDASDNGGGMGAGTTPTTATTCTTATSTCQVAPTSSPADDQDKSSKT